MKMFYYVIIGIIGILAIACNDTDESMRKVFDSNFTYINVQDTVQLDQPFTIELGYELRNGCVSLSEIKTFPQDTIHTFLLELQETISPEISCTQAIYYDTARVDYSLTTLGKHFFLFNDAKDSLIVYVD